MRLGVGAYRRWRQPAGEQLVSYMTGFPTPGNPQPGIAVVGLALGVPTGPYVTTGVYVRPVPASPYSAFAGHPEVYSINVPANPCFRQGKSTFSGFSGAPAECATCAATVRQPPTKAGRRP
jgi:hypothetical protein